ncbi:MAG: hypothetical protein GY796_12575 [Chloroflexi bacterium]|nr:hypothetical protein [Chloroflexota bacterium]
MKRMVLTFCDREDAPELGWRVFPEGADVKSDNEYHVKACSDEIVALVSMEREKGRRTWLQLTIEIDEFPLYFWLPAELDLVCDVFAAKPFPTALSLAKKSPGEIRLNNHWLSRLPKSAKSPKYRERFLKYVASSPPELQTFREFYN